MSFGSFFGLGIFIVRSFSVVGWFGRYVVVVRDGVVGKVVVSSVGGGVGDYGGSVLGRGGESALV